MFDRRLIFHINWGLLILTAILFLIGVMNLYSASTLRLASGLTGTVPITRTGPQATSWLPCQLNDDPP